MIKNDLHDISKVIADKYGLTIREAKDFTSTFMELVNEGLQEDGLVKIKGFGTFKIIDVKDRESINVTTGDRILIPGRSKVTFTPDSVMKELVNKPFSQFDTVVLNDGVDFTDLEPQLDNESDNEDLPEDLDVPTVDEEIPTEIIPTTLVTIQNEEELEPIESTVSDHTEPSSNEDDINEIVSLKEVQSLKEEVPTCEEYSIPEETSSTDQSSSNDEPLESVKSTDIQQLSDNNQFTFIHNNKEDREMGHRHSRKRTVAWWIPLGFLLSLAIGIAIGYHIGIRQIPAPAEIISEEYADSVRESTVAEKAEVVKDDKDKVTTVKEEKSESVAEKKEVVAETKETTAAVSQAVKQQPAKPATESVIKPAVSANDTQALKNAKQMVSKGAYNIIGTTETITVKPGQTMKKISKFYLGDGMECYIQAYNNIEEVTEGMKLKIPQLKLKKK